MSSFQSQNKAQIGVFGGSGFYKFLDNVEEITVETPFGAPSDKGAGGGAGKIGGEAFEAPSMKGAGGGAGRM